jgi:hypothetical protein
MSPKIVIGTVHPDYIDAQYTRCLVETLADDVRGLFPFRRRVLMERAPAGMLNVARNNVVREFLGHPLQPEYLLFIDTDMVWVSEQIGELLESAIEHDLCAVNALVCMQGGLDVKSAIPVMYDYDMRPVQPCEQIQRVFCAGSAFLLLRRHELQVCGQTYGAPAAWFDYQHRHGKNVTEEVIFSQRYHDLGFPIHVNTQILVGHRKIHPFYMPLQETYGSDRATVTV